MGQLSVAWAVAMAAVVIHTIGIWNVVTVLLSLLTVAASFCLALYWRHVSAADDYGVETSRSRLSLPCPGISSLVAMTKSPPSELRFDQRYTGSSPIDEQIKQVLQLAFRDFVKPWYAEISDDPEFVNQLHQLIQHLIVGLAARIKDVDWVPYLTRKLVEDMVLHLRMFRQARLKFAEQSDAKSVDLESIFFDLEAELEKKRLCRDLVCTVDTYEKDYLRDVARVLLYQLLPEAEFSCRVQLAAAVELLSQLALLPLSQLLTSPDFINRTIVWLCSDVAVTSDVFLTVLRLSDEVSELHATRDSVSKEIALLRSRDIGGDENDDIKDQMSSLLYVRKTIDHRIRRLQEGSDSDSTGLPSQIDWNRLRGPGCKLFNLPLDVMLKNDVALSSFFDYMGTIGEQHYLVFYMNVEGWRLSAEQQLASLRPVQRSSRAGRRRVDIERLREAAQSIYGDCLSEKAQPRVRLDEALQKRLIYSIRSEPCVSETWFDEAQQCVYNGFMEERMYPAFKKTPAYLKLLGELDLLKDPAQDDDDSQSTGSGGDNLSVGSADLQEEAAEALPLPRDLAKVWRIETDMTVREQTRDASRSYTVYAVTVNIISLDKQEDVCTVLRRYSDFHDFHDKVVEKYPSLASLPFPGKKAFNNQTQTFLERRRAGLNTFLNMMLRPDRLQDNDGLLAMAVAFLQIPQYARDRGHLEKTVDSIVQPLRESMRSVGDAVKSAPDSLLQTVDGVVVGLSRVIRGQPAQLRPAGADTQPLRFSALPDNETDDSPLRIVLLLLEEVFDLRSRNQWLRRRMVTFLRQIIKAMFGDRMSRRIVDYVAELTAPDQAAEYVKHLKNAVWPNGAPAQLQSVRDDATRMRTRLAAKTSMLSSVTDELKHILGSETARRGVFLLFDLAQSAVLNRRLLYVLLEGTLELLLPDCDVAAITARLHARSLRVTTNLAASQRRLPNRK